MVKAIKITAELRKETGSSACRRLRRSGKFPGVVYGVGKQPLSLTLDEKLFRRAVHGHSSEHVMIDLEIPGVETKRALLQELQQDPITGAILHADFHEISMAEKLDIDIPVHLTGVPVGVSQQGGLLEHMVRSIRVKCLPGDIVEAFDVDVSALRIGESLKARDIPMDPAKYTLVTDPDLAIAAVLAPRLEEEAAPAAATAAAEPEVIKEKKEEELAAAEPKEKEKEEKTAAKAPAKEAKK